MSASSGTPGRAARGSQFCPPDRASIAFMASRNTVIFEHKAVNTDRVWNIVATHPSGQQEHIAGFHTERSDGVARQPRMQGIAKNEGLRGVEAARTFVGQTSSSAGVELRRSRISFPGLKYGTTFLSTVTLFLFFGLRPRRAERTLAANVPEPRNSTRSPCAIAEAISSRLRRRFSQLDADKGEHFGRGYSPQART